MKLHKGDKLEKAKSTIELITKMLTLEKPDFDDNGKEPQEYIKANRLVSLTDML